MKQRKSIPQAVTVVKKVSQKRLKNYKETEIHPEVGLKRIDPNDDSRSNEFMR